MVRVIVHDDAGRSLAALPRALRRRLLTTCRELLDDWGIGKPLEGRLHGHRALRVGVYRIIYVVKQGSQVEIVAIGHRKDIYERMK